MSSRGVVAYYRVSTARQGRSGLGLEAQKHAVAEYLADGRCKLVSEFVEVESGRRDGRPELQRALAACRVHRATLVVAKLDRLSRNAAFLLTLRDSDVEFVASDMPGANRLTVGILAMVAENEAEAISARTRAALAAAKRRGVRLGGHPERISASARRRGAALSVVARRDKANRRNDDLLATLEEIRHEGTASLRGIAAALRRRGIPAPRGGLRWHPTQVQRILNAIARLS